MIKSNIDKNTLEKSSSGIRGLDEITEGGLPKGRPTLICGSAGCGKTLFAMQFLVHGAEIGEPGVFVSFEETQEELEQNFRSLGLDLKLLEKQGKFLVEYIYLERSEIEETGEFDLEGLFIRLAYAIEKIGAKRIVLDTLEALFAGLPNEFILRAELRRLFGWLKTNGLTAIITGETGEKSLTRYGLEEYVADCVIKLDNPVTDKISTRNLRIIKYRGSSHGSNEYPFLIDANGISVLPITSLMLEHEASTQIIPTGIPRLDSMLGNKGFYKGSSILITGAAGNGKSSMSAIFADNSCKNGNKCLFFAFEESPKQIIRNMKSIGIDLKPWVDKGLLKFHSTRPTLYGLETHLVNIHKMVNDYNPDMVIFDPISNLITVGTSDEVKSMLTRLIDFLKNREITTLSTSLRVMGQLETDIGVSSLMDTWIDLKALETNGERNRTIDIIKTRGMFHSNQVREFIITNNGIKIVDLYLGPNGMVTGSARISQISREKADKLIRQQEIERQQRELEQKRQTIDLKIKELESNYKIEKQDLDTTIEQEKLKEESFKKERDMMAKIRHAVGDE
ncbi:MAG: circadian clock protein KaiC [Methanobacterium sp.]|uniref:circadian clock protein KaiC n=1 Tax=Methanobacterium sp. TaxID=2164 RepID=UPI003C7484E2